MRMLLRAFTLILLGFVLLTTLTVMIGRVHAAENPLSSLGLATCGKFPCLLGIAPVISTWDQVRDRLNDQYKITYLQAENILVAENTHDYHIYIYPEQMDGEAKTVRKISIKAFSEFPLAGDLLLLYGEPCNFLIESDQLASLTYPNMFVFIRFTGGRVSIFSPVSSISIVSTELTVKCYPERWRRWAGFKGIDSYKARWPTRCIECGSSTLQ
ncbi:MAG: hypothetical protein KF716_17195 [Anaerolineae bacterium]|nr:hypothetical protein [Anaerolineae bacterium]